MALIKRFPIHPFFFAIYPVIALLGHNITEVSPDVIVRPLAIAIVGALVLLGLLRLALRDWLKAALVVTLLLILFFTYGQVYNFLKASPAMVSGGLARHRFLLPVYALLLAAGLFAILRGKKDFQAATQALNLIGLFLMVFPVYQVASYAWSHPAGDAAAKKWTPQVKLAASAAPQKQPDVYYIILDGYARADVIKQKLGYDNAPFLDQLRGLGFVIGECSRSNYGSTHTSLNSSLNMEYLPTIYQWTAEQGLPAGDVWSFIKHSQVRKQFETLGYKIVAFDTGYEWTRWEDADLYLSRTSTPYGLQWVTPFESMFVDSTLASVYTDAQAQAYRSRFSETQHPKSYFINQELFKLGELPKIADIADPTFTFAHILIPHVPHVFSPQGILTDPGFFSGTGENPINDHYFKLGYLDDIQFANQQIIRIVTYILQHSSTPPVIVIQGDHGFGENRLPNLNVYYLPGEGKNKLYPAITPVNTFRLIFDTYFGGSYGLLPDQSYIDDKSSVPTPEYGPACK